MDILPLQTDELLVGYRGRLAAANHCSRPSQLRDMLWKHYPPRQGFTGAGLVPSLSRALHLSEAELIQHHTTYPLFAAFPCQKAWVLPCKSPYADSYSTAWLKLARKHLWLCPQCVSGDLRTTHISFWKRSHQVPGLFHCPHHGAELLSVDPKPLFTERPHDVIHRATSGATDAVAAGRDNPIVRRTIAVLAELLVTDSTTSRQAIMMELRAAAGITGAKLALVRADLQRICRAINRHVPRAWLADAMPHVKARNPEDLAFVKSLLWSRTGAISSASVALLLALFEVDVATASSMIRGSPPHDLQAHLRRLALGEERAGAN